MDWCSLVWSIESKSIFGSLIFVYIVLVIVITFYSFTFIGKYNLQYSDSNSRERFKMYFQDIYHRRLDSIITISLHIICQIANVSVIIMFYQSSTSNSNNTHCKTVNNIFFISLLVIKIFYKLLSISLLIYYGKISQFMRFIKLFFMQLIDFEIIYTLHLHYLFNEKNKLMSTTRFIILLHTVSVSIPICYIQIIYIFMYGYNGLIILSFICSLINIITTQLRIDNINLDESAEFSPTYILRVLCRILDVLSTLFLHLLICLIMGWVTFIIVISLLLCITIFLTYCAEELGRLGEILLSLMITIDGIIYYQLSSQLIYLILLTIWITVKFECPTCPWYTDRGSIISDNHLLFAIFICCWVIRCWLFVMACTIFSDYFESGGSSKNIQIELNELEWRWYGGYRQYYKKPLLMDCGSVTMLMKAIKLRQIIICHELLLQTDSISIYVKDLDEENILDYIFKPFKGQDTAHWSWKNKESYDSYDSYHYCCSEWMSWMVTLYKKDPKLRTNNKGRNIFLCACYIGDMECIKKLIEIHPEIINSTDDNKRNGCSLGAEGNQSEVCKYLEDNYGLSGETGSGPLNGETYKMILLGIGSSGKSTLFNHLEHIYDEALTKDKRLEWKGSIMENIVSGMKQLRSDLNIKDAINDIESYDHLSFDDLDLLDYNAMQQLAQHMNLIWSFKDDYCITDNLDFWMKKVFQVFERDYIPTFEDVLRCKSSTFGINENKLVICGDKFNYFDVGGIRSQRNRWEYSQLFEDVDAVIFVASLSSISEVLKEDISMNGMKETIKIWNEIVNKQRFKYTKIYLLFNKVDRYRDILKRERIKITEHLAEIFVDNEIDKKLKYFDIDYNHSVDLFDSKYTLLSHGFIHDIQCEYVTPKEIIQIIDMFVDTYFEALFDESINYITNRFVENKNNQLKQIKTYILSVMNREEVESMILDINQSMTWFSF